ncbi:MAG: ABC transporter permease, partial [Pseudomonadales bacterium]|nr:ABC transporter permease [Pseudomonadales bacterium]
MNMFNDFKYSFRLLRKTPGFTFTTLGVMALGLSLYLASATLGRMMSDQPLPFPDGDRYVSLKSIISPSFVDVGHNNFDLYTYNQLKEISASYSALGAFNLSTAALSYEESVRQYSSTRISSELFNATQQAPVLGRSFTDDDAVSGAGRVAVISYTIWQEFYNADPDVIGHTDLIDGEVHTIIGVMPEGFHFPLKQDVWTPLIISEGILPNQGMPVSIAGILAEGIDHAAAELELNALYSQIIEDYPESYREAEHRVLPFASLNWSKASPLNDLAFVVEATSLIILALTVVNLSSLLLIRSTARQTELQIRSSVGANRLQLSKQVLAESLIICLLGFVLSLLFTSILLPVVQSQMEYEVGRLDFWFNLALDLEALATGIVLTLIIWIASGLLAAYRAYKSDSGLTLNASNKGVTGSGSTKTSRAIVVVEMVFTSFLLVCCGAVIYLFEDFADTDFGFSTNDYVIANVRLDTPAYDDTQRQLAYLDNLKRNIQSLPNTVAASITTSPPGETGANGFYDLDDRDLTQNGQLPPMMSIWTEPGYFEHLGFQITQGRSFDNTDTSDSTAVVIVTDQFAETLWPDDTAIGKQI